MENFMRIKKITFLFWILGKVDFYLLPWECMGSILNLRFCI